MTFSGYGLPMDLPRAGAALRDVDSANPEIRWIAAMSLGRAEGEIQEAAVEALSRLAGDPGEDVRAQAIEGLANQARFGAKVEADVGRWLADPSDIVRCAALTNAEAFGGDAGEAARRMLSDPAPAVRATAARALGERGDAAQTGALGALLEDPVGAVREEAALSLVRLGDVRGLGIAAALLGQGGEDAARACVALGLGGLAAASAALEGVIERRFASNEGRALAAAALVRCGRADAGGVVARMLGSRWRRARLAAAQAIALLPFPGAAELVAARIPGADAMEASILIQTLAAAGAEDRDAALAAMRTAAARPGLPEEIAEELREAARDLAAGDA